MITLFTSVKFVILVKIFAVNRTIKSGRNEYFALDTSVSRLVDVTLCPKK